MTILSGSLLSAPAADPLPKTLAYNLDMNIDFETEKLLAECKITFSNNSDRSIGHIPLLLYRLLSVKSVTAEDNMPIPFTQKIVSVSGREKLQVNFIEIQLQTKLQPHEQKTINMEYDGYLLGYTETGWLYVRDHIGKDFTIIRTDGFGYPIAGYPDSEEMWAIVKESYDYRAQITVPEDVLVANGGELDDKIPKDNKTTWIYKSRKPSWRMDFAVSGYRLLTGNDNKVFYFPQDSLGARSIMTALKNSLNLYTNWFGPLDNFPGYSIIEVPEGYGSQQDITCSMLTADNFKSADKMEGLYHEISHLWNVKSLDKQPCRVESEGYAQFTQFLALEKLENRENAVAEAAQRYIDRLRKNFNEKKELQTIPIKDYGVRDMTEYSYTLGMVMFAVLYNKVGEKDYNKMIGSFYKKYHAAGATLDDFTRHFSSAASVNLDRFFDEWIYTTKAISHIMDGKTYTDLLELYTNNN
jgi:aminopeptidase N